MGISEFFNEISWLPFELDALFVPIAIFLWNRKPKEHCIEGMILCFFIWLSICYYLIPHPIVYQEKLTNLTERSITLENVRTVGKGSKIYGFINSDGTYSELEFELCDKTLHEIPKYAGKKIKIWYKNNWVYQVTYNNNIVFHISESNRRAKFVTISNFNFFLSILFLCIIIYLNALINMSKEDNKEMG